MRRLFSFTAPLLIALALPSLAQASTGTVLSVSQPKHELQLVTANNVVHAYSFSGELTGVKQGTELSFKTARSHHASRNARAHITRAKVLGTSNKFSFLGAVVRSGNDAVVLSLGDSQRLRLATTHPSSQRARAEHRARGERRAHCDSNTPPTVTIEINGLEPGETVLVTESTDSSGDVTISITVPPAGSSQFGPELTATGVVNDVGTAAFDIITSDQSDLQFHMAAAALASLSLSSCDSVVVSYHMDEQMMIADRVVDNGAAESGSCANAGSREANANAIGTITAVSATSITVTASAGAQTFTVENPSVTLGFIVGDSVNVTYEQTGNEFVADEVEYDNALTSGVVTGLAAGGAGFDTITLTNDFSNQSETFYVPTDLLTGQGVLIGDDINISYYQAARGLTLDHLHDNGPAS